MFAFHYDPAAAGCFILAVASLLVMARIGAKAKVAPARQRLDDLAAGTAIATGTVRAGNAAVWATSRRNRLAERHDALRERLLQAGLYSPRMRVTFYMLRVAGFVVPVAIGYWVGHHGWLTVKQGLGAGATFGLLGTLLPGLWLDHLKAVRQAKIRRALPDALDVMTVCLQGGLSLNVALSYVARELNFAHPALADELHIVGRQIEMGSSTGDAIRDMAGRFDLDELRSMASVLTQAEKIGASVATALELFADTMRIKRHQRAEELAHKAAIKLMIPTLLCVFPSVFVVILGPAVIRFATEVLPGFLH